MSIKLTDAQLVMLSAAAQRDDRCLALSTKLKGGAAQKVADKLTGAGFAKEIKAKPVAPVWRRDDKTGQTYALKLTAAGARAIVVDEEEPANEIAVVLGRGGEPMDLTPIVAASRATPAWTQHCLTRPWPCTCAAWSSALAR